MTVADLVGTWKYNAPACEFQSDDLLKKAGGSLVSNQIEEKLSGIYSKVGLTADQFSYTFAADSSFTCQLKDRAISGTVSKEADSEQVCVALQCGARVAEYRFRESIYPEKAGIRSASCMRPTSC